MGLQHLSLDCSVRGCSSVLVSNVPFMPCPEVLSIYNTLKCYCVELHLQKVIYPQLPWRNSRFSLSYRHLLFGSSAEVLPRSKSLSMWSRLSAQGSCRSPHFWGLCCKGLSAGAGDGRMALQGEVAHRAEAHPFPKAGTMIKGMMLPQ